MSAKGSRSLVQRAFDLMAEQNIKHSRLYSQEPVRIRTVPPGLMELIDMPIRSDKHRDSASRPHKRAVA